MFETNVLLKRHSHYKIGGEARYFFEAEKADNLIKAAEERWKVNKKFGIDLEEEIEYLL